MYPKECSSNPHVCMVTMYQWFKSAFHLKHNSNGRRTVKLRIDLEVLREFPSADFLPKGYPSLETHVSIEHLAVSFKKFVWAFREIDRGRIHKSVETCCRNGRTSKLPTALNSGMLVKRSRIFCDTGKCSCEKVFRTDYLEENRSRK